MTHEELEAAESEAAHAAIEVYFEVLSQLVGKDDRRRLSGTEHVHGSVSVGDVTGLIEFRIKFDTSPAAVATALRMARERGSI